MLEIPVSAREKAKLPLAKMKQMLKFNDVLTVGTKDQLVLRLVAVRAGTKHLLFQNEKAAPFKEKEQAIITDEIKYRMKTFKTQENASLSSTRPRESAGAIEREKAKVQDIKFLDWMTFDSLHLMFAET